MYRSPRARSSPQQLRKEIPEGPIHDFWTVIEHTPAENWTTRVDAFRILVANIPEGSQYSQGGEAWYNSPPILRHLAIPLQDLIRDARSTVVKQTCEAAEELFAKCQIDARYLLKDIMPTILAVHGQTVQVIRNYVQSLVVNSLPVVPCKMAMPIWLERLKSDKSRSIREACALYLGIALEEWNQEGYLSDDIWNQVGSCLVKALRDKDPNVRLNAKRALEKVCFNRSDIFQRLMNNEDLLRDARVRRTMGRIESGESANDDVSIASSRFGGSVSSRNYRPASTPTSAAKGYGGNGTSSSSRAVPRTIVGGMGGASAASTPTAIPAPKPRGGGGGLGPPVRLAQPFKRAVESPSPPDRFFPSTPSSDKAVGESFDTVDSELPIIANKNELQKVAQSKRETSRRSSLLMERMARSGSNLTSTTPNLLSQESQDSTIEDLLEPSESAEQEVPSPRIVTVGSHSPEHHQIAEELLEAHKNHVDQIMETLKLEMDVLKDFEQLLIDEGNHPTEEEVLDYFESVGLCLDQRTQAGNILRKAMNRISKGSSS